MPETYVAYRTEAPIEIDGRLDEAAWAKAPRTAAFVDIQGDPLPKPGQATTARMLWDDEFFYVAAELDETDLWATLTKRDSIIFHDNDFEVFLDPDGDTHLYYELEINALGTEWDLLLVKPYRDGGPALPGFDTEGLVSAVSLRGTLNDRRDRDAGWSVEIAIPWAALAPFAGTQTPPADRAVWRVNFSRVQWQLDPEETAGSVGYQKRKRADGGALPEDNWVWSPQGVIAMHEPESWGYVQFTDTSVDGLGSNAAFETFQAPPDLEARAFLRRAYSKEHAYRAVHGAYTANVAALGLGDSRADSPTGSFVETLELFLTPTGFEATLVWLSSGRTDSVLWLRADGAMGATTRVHAGTSSSEGQR